MRPRKPRPDLEKLDRLVAETRRRQDRRGTEYREQALGMYPWVCGRCGRTFTHANLHELTVHHRNHNHDDNPPDGSNWELLCLYCHDNEHARQLEQRRSGGGGARPTAVATGKPFGDLKELLAGKEPRS